MTYWEICKQGFIMCDMPSANHVCGEYLETKGFIRSPIREGEDFTIRDFCRGYSFRNGGYSREGDIMDMLREMMNGADEREREAIKRCLKELDE